MDDHYKSIKCSVNVVFFNKLTTSNDDEVFVLDINQWKRILDLQEQIEAWNKRITEWEMVIMTRPSMNIQ